jgi:phage terminase large subunit
MKHALITPNGKTLIGANFTSQYRNTIKQEFEELFPNDFITGCSTQYDFYDLYNGHRIQYRMFDDPDRLRSYNISMFVIIEASECKAESFTQLRARLRNTAATAPLKDAYGEQVVRNINGEKVPQYTKGWRKGLLESNPDSGWIKNDILLRAEQVVSYGDVIDLSLMQEQQSDIVSDLSVVLTATSANVYLPEGYIRQVSEGKPAHWVARFINASFSYTEARVFPDIEKCFTTMSFEIPPKWKRLAGLDWGLVDPSVFLFAAVDPDTGNVWLYKEVRTNEKSIKELASIFKEESKDIPLGGWYTTPLIDPVSGGNRNAEKKTIIDLFAENGGVWQPGARIHKTRIAQISTYAVLDRLKIMQPRCSKLCEELVQYLYKKDTRVSSGYSDSPQDGNDHGCTCLGFVFSGLPSNPNMLRVQDVAARMQSGYGSENAYGLHALAMDDWASPQLEVGDNVWTRSF